MVVVLLETCVTWTVSSPSALKKASTPCAGGHRVPGGERARGGERQDSLSDKADRTGVQEKRSMQEQKEDPHSDPPLLPSRTPSEMEAVRRRDASQALCGNCLVLVYDTLLVQFYGGNIVVKFIARFDQNFQVVEQTSPSRRHSS